MPAASAGARGLPPALEASFTPALKVTAREIPDRLQVRERALDLDKSAISRRVRSIDLLEILVKVVGIVELDSWKTLKR